MPLAAWIGIAVVLLLIIIAVAYYALSGPAASDPVPTLPNTPTAPSYPGGLVEGEVVQCHGLPSIYVLMNGQKHHFPNMEVYISWGSPVPKMIDDCALLDSIPNGDPVTKKA